MPFRFLLLLLFCVAPVRAQEGALLLGWRIEGERRAGQERVAPTYRSLLVYAEPDGTYRGQSASGLFLAGPRSVVRTGVKKSQYNAWSEAFVWASPVGAVPAYSGIDPFNGEYCRGYRDQTIRFASATFVAVETRSAGYCEGTASPWDFRTYSVLRTDSLVGDGLDLQAVLGDEALEAFFEGSESFLDGLSETRQAQFIPEPDPANWSLVHRRGRWQLVGRLESAEVGRGSATADFDVSYDLPDTFDGPHGAMPWERVTRAARDARDVFVSPTGTLVAIQRPLLLTIHPVEGGRIQPAVLGQPLPAGTSVVSVQWLDARSGQRMRQVLRGEGSR